MSDHSSGIFKLLAGVAGAGFVLGAAVGAGITAAILV